MKNETAHGAYLPGIDDDSAKRGSPGSAEDPQAQAQTGAGERAGHEDCRSDQISIEPETEPNSTPENVPDGDGDVRPDNGGPWLLAGQQLPDPAKTAVSEAGSVPPSLPDDEQGRPASEVDEEITWIGIAATARLESYQLSFGFIEEERPTADGRVTFITSPGVLECGLSAIALPSLTGKSARAELALSPGRIRLRLQSHGLIAETDLPLADFANLPRNGVCVATDNAKMRRLLSLLGGRERLHETNNATFVFEPSPNNAWTGDLRFKFNGASIPLAAEWIETDPPLSALTDQHLFKPITARALARGLRYASVFRRDSYYGPILVSEGAVKAFSCDAVIEYEHAALAGLELTIPIEHAGDLASLLQRARRGLRLRVQESHTAFADDIMRYQVPKPLQRMPQYGEMKTEALAAPPIELSRPKLVPWLVFLNAVTAIKGLPTTVRLVVEQEEEQRQLYFTVDRAMGPNQIAAGPVGSDYEVGDLGQVPMNLLLKLTGSAEFETRELQLASRAGALVQKGDGAVLTCIFPFREAVDEDH